MSADKIDQCLTLLTEIAKSQRPKTNGRLIMEFDSNTQSVVYTPPLTFNRPAELALLSISFYNSIPNVDSTNNKFIYSMDAGATYKTITIPIGAYEITDIKTRISDGMTANGDDSSKIVITANSNTFHIETKLLTDQIKVNYSDGTVKSLFGYGSTTTNITGPGTFISPQVANISNLNRINLTCSGISGSYINSNVSQV